MKTNELSPINGIQVFEALGSQGDFDFLERNPNLSSEKHIVLATCYGGSDLEWQGVLFFVPDKRRYSNVEARDYSVEKISESDMIQVLCCDAFFAHLDLRHYDLNIALFFVDKTEADDLTYKVKSFDSVEDVESEERVEANVKDVSDALDLLAMDLLIGRYTKIAESLYFKETSTLLGLKKVLLKLEQYKNHFLKSLKIAK
ncbi:hypothetical protein A2914_00880 [Candidatus Nomurabacteria bacterium RIFCSPLOWO2_01_FULL_41_21]|uniref:Uncharacterized protein n=2 Tax=Candidatus Nomuraibacteriota TaxID=1752729 RepID=A0A1F6V273_9BACT|nr:MAG: hypothetical protein A2733_01970 [Candidatus Nomurabacteria bacterium RIFCSPHIGHO2_01_FULL_40_20]OGI87870.1 MAG: hypothetical protein A2914_00880 [Candidatus Nomurabacteria bacterium RIFCSPLOWO2_01_FULL_41_21]